jgi:hypothetical protein
MEKNNADMDFTCKFNTYLEKAFFEPFCEDLASNFAVLTVLRRPKFLFYFLNQVRYQ